MTLGALVAALTLSLYVLNLGPFSKEPTPSRKPQGTPEQNPDPKRGFGRRSR